MLSDYLGLQKVMDAQLFKESSDLTTRSQRRPALELGDGTRNIKQVAIILTKVEMVAHKLVIRLKIE